MGTACPVFNGLTQNCLDDRLIVGSGVICATWALEVAVIPAKAGIHPANLWRCAVYRLDSRFRGNDWCFEMDATPIDTDTRRPTVSQLGSYALAKNKFTREG